MSPRARAILSGLAVAVLFLLPLLPEVFGSRRLVFRDAHITHWPWRRVAMGQLAAGRVPLVNPSASGGEPLLANPNAVLLYPTILLEKVLPAASAFNLHYLLHVLWAFAGARALARRLGLSAGPAFFSGVAFAFSGMMMSLGSAFANSAAAASWLPWCAAATLDLARARHRGAALSASAAASIAFGLQLLAGEPALSLLTLLFAAYLGLGEILAAGAARLRTAGTLLFGGAAAGLLAAALAAPLLLPLAQVLPLTYRGQHLFSERASGASPFAAWRLIEWLFPRFDGDPGALAAGAHWQYALHGGDLVYIWCVTLGVIPLVALLVAALRKGFWERRARWLAGGAAVSLLFAFGSSLPFYPLLLSIPALRRFRYPIKFYLLATLCAALLAGLAAERLRPGRERAGRREGVFLALILILYAAAFLFSGAGGPIERAVEPLLAGLAAPPSELLPAIRTSLRGDALFGLLAASVVGLVLYARRPIRGQSYLLGFTTLLLAFPWALPLFVSAGEKELERPPALLSALGGGGGGGGRVHISQRLPEFNVLATGSAHPKLEPRVVKLARAQVEELIPATGAAFGVEYVFDADPDGSYGYYNRLAGEALAASSPAERLRLLRTFGGRWLLSDEGADAFPLRPVTGVEVAGRRLVLSSLPDPLAPLRWAGRAHRRRSLSGALELVRSAGFRPEEDVVLPGREDGAGAALASEAKVEAQAIEADRAAARVEARGPGHLLFSRTYFSAWKARLDGRPAPVLVANARDLAVAVPAGSHRVEFEYDRGPFSRGVGLQAAALLFVLAAALVPRRSLSS